MKYRAASFVSPLLGTSLKHVFSTPLQFTLGICSALGDRCAQNAMKRSSCLANTLYQLGTFALLLHISHQCRAATLATDGPGGNHEARVWGVGLAPSLISSLASSFCCFLTHRSAFAFKLVVLRLQPAIFLTPSARPCRPGKTKKRSLAMLKELIPSERQGDAPNQMCALTANTASRTPTRSRAIHHQPYLVPGATAAAMCAYIPKGGPAVVWTTKLLRPSTTAQATAKTGGILGRSGWRGETMVHLEVVANLFGNLVFR